MNETDYFAVVVGAGPAGTAAAIQLASKNYKTLLIDKAEFPRDKICGDGLTADALQLLEELDIDVSAIPTYQAIEEMRIYSPSGRINKYSLSRGRQSKRGKKKLSAQQQYASLPPHAPKPLAAVVARRELDMALLERARELGVEISLETTFMDVNTHFNYLEFQTSVHKKLTAQYLIAADGMWSSVRKSLGLTAQTNTKRARRARRKMPTTETSTQSQKKYLGDWHAFRQYYEDVSDNAKTGIHVWFEPDLLPGYFWSFPLAKGGANVGFGVSRKTHKTGKLAQKFQELLERPHIRKVIGPDAKAIESVKAWPIPTDFGHLPLVGQRAFFTGDAAAMTDPLTGEGIAQAIETGILSAKAAIAYPQMGGDDATQKYEQSVLKEFSADVRLSKFMGRILKTPFGARSALRLSSTNSWVSRKFARWLFAEYPRALLFTPSRWRKRPKLASKT